MTTTGPTLAPPTLAWAERCLAPGARVVGAVRLGGHTGPWLLSVRRSGDEFAVVLRAGDPQSVHECRRFGAESAALQAAEQYRVAAPRLIGRDLTGHDASQLAVLSTHRPGVNTVPQTASRDRLVALGSAVASLSLATPDEGELPIRQRPLSDLDFEGERRAGASTPLLDEAARFLAASSVPASRTILVHGDCWQGNLLWNGDAFTGFVDWDAAGVGQPGLDLGSLRFDAALYYGLDQLDAITEGWRAGGGTPIDTLAYWDLAAALASPTDLTEWLPIITAPGRNDLDTYTITTRRDDFVTAAVRRADLKDPELVGSLSCGPDRQPRELAAARQLGTTRPRPGVPSVRRHEDSSVAGVERGEPDNQQIARILQRVLLRRCAAHWRSPASSASTVSACCRRRMAYGSEPEYPGR